MLDHELSAIDGAVELPLLERGMRIYDPGEPSDSVFLVRSGVVKISVAGTGTKCCLRRLVSPGQIFGEECLFGEVRRTAEAEVVDPASLVTASCDAVRRHLSAEPQAWEGFALQLAQRVRALEDRIEGLCLHEAEQRIARLLMNWVEAARDRGAGDPVEITLTQRDLGGLVGATRETMSVALNRLRNAGCIDMARRKLVVRSVEKLAQRLRPPTRGPASDVETRTTPSSRRRAASS